MKNSKNYEQISNLALKALMTEVSAAPKPGLVDRLNNGAHKDMDFYTFIDSSFSLASYFLRCSEAGAGTDDLPELFSTIRAHGIEAEAEMYKATKGVNTHKGSIFTLGILITAVSFAVARQSPFSKHISCLCSEMCKNIIDEDFKSLDRGNISLTAGQRLYVENGITGVRGEAQAGFPSVFETALPFFRELMQHGVNINDAAVQTLLLLIARTCDTNIISRTGFAGLGYAQEKARAVLEAGGILNSRKAVEDLDQEFIRKNISPGGCADLLAATCFLYFLYELELICD